MQVCLCVQRADWQEAKLTTAAVSLQGRKHLWGGCFILKTQKCRVFWPESCAALVKLCVSLHLAFEGVCWLVLRGNGWHCNSAITPPEWWLPPSDSISLITLNSKWIVSLSSAAAAQRNCWDIKSSHYLEAEDARSRSSCLYVNGGSSCVTYLTFDGKLSSRARILLECARVCWYQRCEIQMALLNGSVWFGAKTRGLVELHLKIISDDDNSDLEYQRPLLHESFSLYFLYITRRLHWWWNHFVYAWQKEATFSFLLSSGVVLLEDLEVGSWKL